MKLTAILLLIGLLIVPVSLNAQESTVDSLLGEYLKRKERTVPRDYVDNIPPQSIDFLGKLINFGSPLLRANNDFVSLENMWHYDGGVGTRLGMTDYTSDSAPGGVTISWVAPFNHENGFILLASVSDVNGTTVYQIEDKSFGTTELFKTSGVSPITGGMVRDSFLIANSSGVSIWGGVSCFPLTILEEDGQENFTDRSEWIHDGKQHTVPSGNTWYVGYSRPFDAVQADKDSGTWDTSFASSVTEEFKGGFLRYWATCVVTAGTSTFEYPKIKTTPRPLTGTWDGESWMYPYSAVFQKTGTSEFQDYSLFVADASPETYMDISEMQSGATIAFGFLFKPKTIRIEFPENNKNEAIVTSGVSYWNGTAIAALSSYVDGTAHGGAAFAEDGFLEYTLPTNWELTTFGENKEQLYWLFLGVSGTIDNYVRIYSVKAIPSTDNIDPTDKHYTGVVIANERVHLYNGDDPGKVVISAYRQPDVYVGDDAESEIDNFRIGRREKFITGVPLDGGVLWFKESENWYQGGYNPITFEANLKQLSNTEPCVASQSAALVPLSTGSWVAYATSNGIRLINKEGINPPIDRPVKAYWEKGNALEIPTAWLDDTIGAYDPVNNALRFLVASGSGSTQFNTMLVYQLDKDKWTTFTFNNNVELSYMKFLKDSTNNPLLLGGGYSGQVWEMDKGSTDDGYAIISIAERGDRVFGVGKTELMGIAFNYELPDGADISGCSLYLTPATENAYTEYQTTLTLPYLPRWKFSRFSSTTERKGFTHRVKLRVPGRINLLREILWPRLAPWAH